jgi:ParB-like chromosome segregation protein Spo0J
MKAAMAPVKEVTTITKTGQNMEFHPVADLFPMMSQDEFEVLCLDIATNGLREPILLANGMIADGRNRYKACRSVDVDPHYREWNGDGELLDTVVSLNLKRRHLSESQRAMVGAKLANMKQGERTDLSEISGKLSQVAAAEIVKVSPDSVGFAKKVIEKGVPELVEAVEKDELAVSTAARIAGVSPKKQKAMIKAGRVSGKKLAIKYRTDALKRIGRRGQAGCLCDGAAVFDAPAIAAVMELFSVKAAAYAREHGTPNFAGIFQGVVFDLTEDELSGMKGENAKKLLAVIDAGTVDGETGLRERVDLQKLAKITWAEFNDAMTYLLDYGLVEALEQGGKTDAARGARKTIYRRSAKEVPGELTYTAENADDEPEDVYIDNFADDWGPRRL